MILGVSHPSDTFLGRELWSVPSSNLLYILLSRMKGYTAVSIACIGGYLGCSGSLQRRYWEIQAVNAQREYQQGRLDGIVDNDVPRIFSDCFIATSARSLFFSSYSSDQFATVWVFQRCQKYALSASTVTSNPVS